MFLRKINIVAKPNPILQEQFESRIGLMNLALKRGTPYLTQRQQHVGVVEATSDSENNVSMMGVLVMLRIKLPAK